VQPRILVEAFSQIGDRDGDIAPVQGFGSFLADPRSICRSPIAIKIRRDVYE